MQKHSKAVEPTARIAETLWNMNPQSVETVTQTYKAWLDQTNKIQEETMRFAQERFAKDLEAAAQLARCSNPTEAIAVQTGAPLIPVILWFEGAHWRENVHEEIPVRDEGDSIH